MPVPFFQTRIIGGGSDSDVIAEYDVAPDGRFLINAAVEAAVSPITILQKWQPPGAK